MKHHNLRPVLLKLSFVAHVPRLDVAPDERQVNQLLHSMQNACEEVFRAGGCSGGWQSSTLAYLDVEGVNAGRCAVCGDWVTDVEKPSPLEGLSRGASVKGRLLCDEHLPPDHPWAF